MKTVILLTALSTFLASAAQAQFRPGASAAGGRIGVLCNNELFDSLYKKTCFEQMNALKGKEREAFRAEVQARAKELETAREEQLKKDGSLADRAVHEYQSRQ